MYTSGGCLCQVVMVSLQPQHYSSHRPGVIARLADSLSLTCRLAPRRCEMIVGFAFSDFKDLQVALGKLKKEQYHPLRVYNSQSAADYNKKRANAKSPPHQLIRCNYSVRCVHYRDTQQSRGKGKGIRPIREPSPKVVRRK